MMLLKRGLFKRLLPIFIQFTMIGAQHNTFYQIIENSITETACSEVEPFSSCITGSLNWQEYRDWGSMVALQTLYYDNAIPDEDGYSPYHELTKEEVQQAAESALSTWNGIIQSGNVYSITNTYSGNNWWSTDGVVKIIANNDLSYFQDDPDAAGYTWFAVQESTPTDLVYDNTNYDSNTIDNDYQHTIVFLNISEEHFNHYHWEWDISPSYDDVSETDGNDIQTVITHELGHVLGLGHNTIWGSIMGAIPVNSSQREIDQTVRDAISALYNKDINSALLPTQIEERGTQ